MPLTTAEAGQQIIIRRIHESAEEDHHVMVFLEQHRLMPGTEAVVEEVIPFNETVSLAVEGQKVVLGHAVAKKVFVQVKA